MIYRLIGLPATKASTSMELVFVSLRIISLSKSLRCVCVVPSTLGRVF
jgi:hypothetical protein